MKLMWWLFRVLHFLKLVLGVVDMCLRKSGKRREKTKPVELNNLA